jgi:hypothetical protein
VPVFDRLTSLQFFFHGLSNEASSILAVAQNSPDPSERPLREARLHVFSPAFLSAHA